jgi:phage portal protein BeeE
VIERPAGATWKPEQRDQFVADVRAQFSGDGPRRNGVLLLEDGMSLKGEQFSAREAQWIDAAKLSLALIAAVYHVNPTMVGCSTTRTIPTSSSSARCCTATRSARSSRRSKIG